VLLKEGQLAVAYTALFYSVKSSQKFNVTIDDFQRPFKLKRAMTLGFPTYIGLGISHPKAKESW